jgi:hypothetical protein
LICPSQLNDLKKRIRLGSWYPLPGSDAKLPIFQRDAQVRSQVRGSLRPDRRLDRSIFGLDFFLFDFVESMEDGQERMDPMMENRSFMNIIDDTQLHEFYSVYNS